MELISFVQYCSEFRGVSWGGFGGLGPPGAPKGRQKERKKEKERKREGRKEEKKGIRKKKGSKREQERKKRKKKVKSRRGAPCSFKCKQGLQGRKRQGRQTDGEKDERGAMQFQVQAGAQGKKTSGVPNRRRK